MKLMSAGDITASSGSICSDLLSNFSMSFKFMYSFSFFIMTCCLQCIGKRMHWCLGVLWNIVLFLSLLVCVIDGRESCVHGGFIW